MLVTLEGENYMAGSFWSKVKSGFKKATKAVTKTVKAVATPNPLNNPLINPMKNPLVAPALRKTPLAPVINSAAKAANSAVKVVMKSAVPILPAAGVALGIPPALTKAALPILDSALKGKINFSTAVKAAAKAGVPVKEFTVAANLISAGTTEARKEAAAKLVKTYPGIKAKIETTQKALDNKEIEVAKKALNKAIVIKAKKAKDILSVASKLYKKGLIR